MSRSHYSDDLDPWDLIRWRGRVASATRGKRGQRFMREMLVALDAMPNKTLIADELENADGDVCAIGCLGRARGIDLKVIDAKDPEAVAKAFDIAEPLACEVAYMNDDPYWPETPARRFQRMREWVSEQIVDSAPARPPDDENPNEKAGFGR